MQLAGSNSRTTTAAGAIRTGAVSNIATTMLVQAAFHLTGRAGEVRRTCSIGPTTMSRRKAVVAALKRRYEGDKTFAVPILARTARWPIWSLGARFPSLPFELACLPQRWYHRLNLTGRELRDSRVGGNWPSQDFIIAPPGNPVMRWIRNAASVKRSLAVLKEYATGQRRISWKQRR